MKESKLFKDMSAEEQEAYLRDFTHFTEEKLPLLCQLGDAWTEAKVKCFEDGLFLLQAFSYCRDFVQKSLYWRDFNRRVNNFNYLLGKVRKEISEGRFLKTASGKKVVTLEQEKKADRGREAVAEDPAPAAETPAAETPAAETPVAETPAAAPEPQAPVNPVPAVSPLQMAVDQIAGTERLNLKQLSWLLSDETKELVSRVQGLRVTATAESEKAKSLAENNADSALIRPHSEAATKAMETVFGIYAAVDRELAELYYRLSSDNDFGGYKAALELRGGSFTALLEVLLPYYNKMGGADFAATLRSNDEVKAEREAVRKAEKERAQKIHTARSYIMRTDLALSSDRLNKMREYLEECRALGYDKLPELEAAVAYTEQQIRNEIENRPSLFAGVSDEEPAEAPAEAVPDPQPEQEDKPEPEEKPKAKRGRKPKKQ